MGFLSKLWTMTDSLWKPKPLVLTKDMEVKPKKKKKSTKKKSTKKKSSSNEDLFNGA